MARYQSARCPQCGALAHRCACGTMQSYSQLSPRNRGNVPPRNYMQQNPNPQQQPQFAAPQGALDVDALLRIPQVAHRVDEIVNEASAGAVAHYQANNPPQVIQEGAHDRDLMFLSNTKVEEIPGDVPKNNTGGRKGTWYAGRKEVHDFFVDAIRGLIMGDKNGKGNSDGEASRNEAAGNVDGVAEVQGGLPANGQVNSD